MGNGYTPPSAQVNTEEGAVSLPHSNAAGCGPCGSREANPPGDPIGRHRHFTFANWTSSFRSMLSQSALLVR